MEWNLTGGRKLLIGMIHCLPLPGTYGATATIDEVIARAVSDAKALERVGFDAVMIENEDLCLEPHMTKVQFSAISMVAQAVRSAVKLPLGLCCSGLNYEEALSIAKVVGGDFIRTPIFVDTVMNYNGIMTPCSGKIIRYRREISAEHVKIFADVQVKHYYMVNPEVDIATSAKWAQHQGADAVIVTGCSTGTETASSDLIIPRFTYEDKLLRICKGMLLRFSMRLETLLLAMCMMLGVSPLGRMGLWQRRWGRSTRLGIAGMCLMRKRGCTICGVGTIIRSGGGLLMRISFYHAVCILIV